MTQMTDDLYQRWESHCIEAGHKQAQHGGSCPRMVEAGG